MADVMLPNGVMMHGVPDGTPWSKVAKSAIQQGVAEPSDFRAYPEIYSEVAPAAQKSSSGGDSDFVAALKENGRVLATDAVKIADAIPDTGNAVLSAISWAGGKLGIGDGTYTPAETFSELEPDSLKPKTKEGEVASEIEPIILGSGELIPKAGKFAFEKLSPIAQAWLSHRVAGSEVESAAEVGDALAESGIHDRSHVGGDMPENEVSGPEGEARAIVSEEMAEDAITEQHLQEESIRNYSSILSESYLLKFMKPTKSGKAGMSAEQALGQYRLFTDNYTFDALPHAGEIDNSLKNYGQYEAQMRLDDPRVRALLERVESGEPGLEDELIDALENYRGTRAKIAGDVLDAVPPAKMRHLQQAAKEHRKLFNLLDVDGVRGKGWRPVTRNERIAAEAGLQEAMDKTAANFGEESKKYNALLSQQWQEARADGIKNVATALEHRMKTLNKMRNNAMAITGQYDKNGELVKWVPLTPDEVTGWLAQSDTHTAAKAGDALMRQYDYMNSLRNALPAVKDEGASDKLLKKATKKGAKLVAGAVGGLPGYLVVDAADGVIGTTARGVIRRFKKRELAKAVEQNAKK